MFRIIIRLVRSKIFVTVFMWILSRVWRQLNKRSTKSNSARKRVKNHADKT